MATTAKPRLTLGRAAYRRLLAAATVLVLLIVVGAILVQRGEDGGVGSVGPEPALYVSSGTLPQHLVEIDPLTLADLPQTAGINLDVSGIAAFSADGSTMAEPVQLSPVCHGVMGNDRTIKVFDTRTGAMRSCEQSPEIGFPRLSGDGSRLIVQSSNGELPPTWYVFDTTNGRLTSTVKAREAAPAAWDWTLIDAKGQRLYWLVPSTAAGSAGPGPLQIFAYDLRTGAETGKLVLHTVLAGTWQSGEGQNGEPLMAQLVPAAALSPDGRQLAIVAADRDAVTLVDTASLTIVRTLPLAAPSSLMDRLVRLLPFVPGAAEAKGLDGPALDAVFAPDGRRLYVFGFSGTVDQNGQPSYAGLGLRVIDLQTGRVVGQGLEGAWLSVVLPTPDGNGLYVAGQTSVHGSGFESGPSYLLARVNPASLASEATRAFPDNRTILLMPAGHGSH